MARSLRLKAFSSEANAGSHEDNGLKQNPGVPIRRIGAGATLFVLWALLGFGFVDCVTPCRAEGRGYRLEPVSFADLPGFSSDKLEDALWAFAKSCSVPAHSSPIMPSLRQAALKQACAATARDDAKKNPREFFERYFQPFRVILDSATDAFFTGYYQPEILGSLTKSTKFPTPVYGLPQDVVPLSSVNRVGSLAELTAARRGSDGGLSPFADRGAIEDGALETDPSVKKLVFLRDKADLFLAQVQGSARVRLGDGRLLHLSFAGRNGQPYTALARILVQRGIAPASEMTMRRLIDWLRQNGLERGEAGDDLLRLNKSYVFFSARFDRNPDEQPKGGSGVQLSPLRSVAVDTHIWPYGLPFYISARMPWRSAEIEPFQRLMIAQDTGSAIVGAARADVFFGIGDVAGERAGEIRHHGQFFLFLPKD
jgi:membrane-bound lytic murein transglycosylase A